MENRLAVKVYYEDTDALGVVYYANYLKYFERSRTELIAGMGKTVREWNEDGYNFVVVKMTIKFHQPGKLGDECEVRTKIVPGSDYKLKMHQRLYRGEQLLTEADVHIACLDEDLTIRELPEMLVVWDDD
ncbi:MAG TPA: YbgC/FadM family acyl-CoA thioesterase [Polyangiaceae bacterium]|nr:YbgC/FadM family acyl-CoA thioesterase [Polyangiaceae bacterium]